MLKILQVFLRIPADVCGDFMFLDFNACFVEPHFFVFYSSALVPFEVVCQTGETFYKLYMPN